MGLLTVMKGLPLAYNKDMQEDKEGVFDTVDTVKGCLSVFVPMLATLKFNKGRMYQAAGEGFSNATDVADYLVKKGVPFRTAHRIVGELVLGCCGKGSFAGTAYNRRLQEGVPGIPGGYTGGHKTGKLCRGPEYTGRASTGAG